MTLDFRRHFELRHVHGTLWPRGMRCAMLCYNADGVGFNETRALRCSPHMMRRSKVGLLRRLGNEPALALLHLRAAHHTV